MILRRIAELLEQGHWEGLSLTKGGNIFILETPDWCIYLSQDDVQYNRRHGKWSMVQVETCPDELVIAIRMLEELVKQYQKEVCK
jgi:hypothetical protein